MCRGLTVTNIVERLNKVENDKKSQNIKKNRKWNQKLF